MTLEAYLEFLEQYWEIFGPIPPRDSYAEDDLYFQTAKL